MRQVHGNGTIQQATDSHGRKRPNVWRIRFNLGRDPMTGKYLYSPWRTVRGTKTDARRELEAYRRELEVGINLDAGRCTFGEYAADFLKRRTESRALAPATLALDTRMIRQISDAIGSVPLQKVDKRLITDFLADLGKEGKSVDRIRRLLVTIKQIMNDALDRDMIARNPCNGIKPPKAEKHDMSYLDPSTLGRFINALEAPHVVQAGNGASLSWMHQAAHQAKICAAWLAIATGARRGEVLGLTWGHIDLDKATIRIDQQQTPTGIRKPKTDNARRVLAIDDDTLQKVKAWKVEQARFLLRLGIGQSEDTPVITNEVGAFLEPHGFSRWWRAFTKRHDFPGLRFHDLRHTQATLLIASGADIKTVQARLGHASASITLDLYAHAMPGKDREAAATIGALLQATQKQDPRPKVVNL